MLCVYCYIYIIVYVYYVMLQYRGEIIFIYLFFLMLSRYYILIHGSSYILQWVCIVLLFWKLIKNACFMGEKKNKTSTQWVGIYYIQNILKIVFHD